MNSINLKERRNSRRGSFLSALFCSGGGGEDSGIETIDLDLGGGGGYTRVGKFKVEVVEDDGGVSKSTEV